MHVALAADKLLLKMMARNIRPLQDFCSWPSYGTASLWDEVRECPELATELMCQWVNGLGAINPTEPTSASIAAHAVAAQYGFPQCLWLSDGIVQEVYESVKAPMCMHTCTQMILRGFDC